MTRRVVTVLEDDVDGGAADDTVRFGLDGTAYEIDLSGAHDERLRQALAVRVKHARRDKRGPQKPRHVSTDVCPGAVRAWAASQNIKISSHGRIPVDLVKKFRAAGN